MNSGKGYIQINHSATLVSSLLTASTPPFPFLGSFPSLHATALRQGASSHCTSHPRLPRHGSRFGEGLEAEPAQLRRHQSYLAHTITHYLLDSLYSLWSAFDTSTAAFKKAIFTDKPQAQELPECLRDGTKSVYFLPSVRARG